MPYSINLFLTISFLFDQQQAQAMVQAAAQAQAVVAAAKTRGDGLVSDNVIPECSANIFSHLSTSS